MNSHYIYITTNVLLLAQLNTSLTVNLLNVDLVILLVVITVVVHKVTIVFGHVQKITSSITVCVSTLVH